MVHTKIKLNTSFKKTINFKQEFFGSRPKIKISKKSLTKSWIAGFIDGDGSFNLEKVDFSKSKNPSNTFFFRPILSISQNDPQLLHKIRDYFGCGKVTRKSEKAWHYRCRNAKDFKTLSYLDYKMLLFKPLSNMNLIFSVTKRCLSLIPKMV